MSEQPTGKKAAAISAAKLRKAFLESTGGRQYVSIALAMFKHAYTSGIRDNWARLQSQWEPLAPRYALWKEARGFSTEKWKMSGATLEAISNNPPYQIGKNGKLKFYFNVRTGLASARPVAFSVPGRAGRKRGRLLGASAQMEVLQVLQRGNALGRLLNYRDQRAKGGYDVTRDDNYLAAIEQVSDRQGGNRGRRLLFWTAAILQRAEADATAAISAAMNSVGIRTEPK